MTNTSSSCAAIPPRIPRRTYQIFHVLEAVVLHDEFQTTLSMLGRSERRLQVGAIKIQYGDLNVELQKYPGFVKAMHEEFELDLLNRAEVPTTCFGSYLNCTFFCNVGNIICQHYITYFSMHKPLLCITDGNCALQWQEKHGDEKIEKDFWIKKFHSSSKKCAVIYGRNVNYSEASRSVA